MFKFFGFFSPRRRPPINQAEVDREFAKITALYDDTDFSPDTLAKSEDNLDFLSSSSSAPAKDPKTAKKTTSYDQQETASLLEKRPHLQGPAAPLFQPGLGPRDYQLSDSPEPWIRPSVAGWKEYNWFDWVILVLTSCLIAWMLAMMFQVSLPLVVNILGILCLPALLILVVWRNNRTKK